MHITCVRVTGKDRIQFLPLFVSGHVQGHIHLFLMLAVPQYSKEPEKSCQSILYLTPQTNKQKNKQKKTVYLLNDIKLNKSDVHFTSI